MIKAKYGDTVKIHYIAKLRDGTLLTTTFKDEPLRFTIGADHVIRDIEKAIIGMNPGESKVTAIPGERIFGPYREENIIKVDRNKLPESKLEVGKRIKIPDQRYPVKVVEVTESKVALDTNHPLATEDLFFDIKLLEIT